MEQATAYPGYATPTFVAGAEGEWIVGADPWQQFVGKTSEHAAGWTAFTERGHYAGLYPDKQAAGEALVRRAGYQVLP